MTEKNNVKIENLPGSEVRISISVPAADFDRYIDQAASEISKGLKVDGFRTGKIPRKMVENSIGHEKLLYEGAQKAIKRTYVDAILDNKIEAIGQPKIEIKKIAQGNEFEFEATVGVMPKIVLKDWKESVAKINKKFLSKKIEVKDAEVERELEYLAKQRAKVVTVNRPAEKGDQVEIDFEVWRNGAPIENGTAKKHLLVLGEGKFIPGFEDQLVGLKAGDKKEFELAFPEQYHEKSLAGQKSLFKVKVNLVQQRQIPEINDEFASGIGKFKNLDDLKSNLHHGIEHEMQHKRQDDQRKEVIDVLVEKSEAELPQVLIDNEIQRMMAELEQNIGSIGLTKEAYLQQLNLSEEALKKQWQEKDAPKRVRAALALRKVAKDQEIAVDSKEIEQRMNMVLQYYKNEKNIEKKLDLESLYETMKGELTNEKTLEYLTGIK